MQWLARGKARGVAVAVALVVVAVASSCGAPGGGGGGGSGRQAAPKPIITPKQAVSVVKNLQAQRETALSAGNGSALASIETDPALTFDQEGLQQVKALGDSLTPTRFLSVVALVPRQTTYPAWFMAIGQVSTGNPALDLFTRSAASKPWQLAVQSGVLGGTVQWKKTHDGWALPADLNVDPSKTLSAYWNAATSGTSTAGYDVAPGSMTSAIASQVNSKLATAKNSGWLQGADFGVGGSLPEAVQLVDGSALSFAWVTEKTQTKDLYGSCFRQPASNGVKWDPLVPNGNYLEVDVTYTYMEGMSSAPSGHLQGISYAVGTTAVQVTGCTS